MFIFWIDILYNSQWKRKIGQKLTWYLVEWLVVFKPRELGRGSAFDIALHLQRCADIHCLIDGVVPVSRGLQGWRRKKEEERERQE